MSEPVETRSPLEVMADLAPTLDAIAIVISEQGDGHVPPDLCRMAATLFRHAADALDAYADQQ